MPIAPNVLDMSGAEIAELLSSWDEPAFRGRQLWEMLYQKKASSFSEMTTLPLSLRSKLSESLTLGNLTLVRDQESTDGETRKFLFQLPDGQFIETVLMEYSGVRRTACISTQAGCAMGCVFCATGQMGFARNLTNGEIVEQALIVARFLQTNGQRLSNLVLMGMGEPFHNYDATLTSIRKLVDPKGMGIGQRHITVSTVGLVPAIKRFATENLQVKLAVSLHAATDEERSELLPINKRYPISTLIRAIKEYVNATGRRVTFEWALISGQNDTEDQAHALGTLLRGLRCHVNLIPLNPTGKYDGLPSSGENSKRFVSIVESYGVPATVRVRRGIDISAGCGQLKTEIVANSIPTK